MAKDICWMSLSAKHPHALGAGIGCLMCELKRREEARQHEGAAAQGLQRPAVARGAVNA